MRAILVAFVIAVAAVPAPTFAQFGFGQVGVIKPSTPLSESTAGKLCYTDGEFLLCDNTAPLVTGSGNVGIGTNVPNTKLAVAGVISATGVSVAGAISATGLVVDANTLVVDTVNNAVGVGTATPATGAKLDVAGKIYAEQLCDETGNNCADLSATGAADNLGNHTASEDLAMAGNDISNVGSLDFGDGSGAGCSASGDRGKIRLNTTTGMLELCAQQ